MKKRRLGCLALVLLAPVAITVVVIISVLFGAESSCNVSSSSSSVATVSTIASDTDWTHEGSTANKNAKLVFDSWVSKGLSGASASGIVGWVNSEGGFALVDRAEGHYGNDELGNGISAGVAPLGGSGYSIGGGGIYQFTPYSKFAEIGDSKWLDVDAQNTFVAKAILSGDWNASMDLTGGNHSFEQMAQMTDPKQATLVWQAYERGNVAYINQEQKQSDAQKAYEMFGGSSHNYDSEKFSQAFGVKADKSSSDSNFKVSTVSFEGCSSSSGGGTGSWSKDGGSVSYGAYNAWKKDDLPADLKPYALNPESVGLKYRSSEGWNAIAYSGGQCTDLSASLMYALWEKNGSHVTMTLGNGQDIAKNWANKVGGSTSKAPTAGSVFSQTPASAGNDVGHTGVVSHVFENGDILVVEQNYAKLSGENGGFGQYTWNYRYVPKSQYANGWMFYDLSKSGYKIVSSASSVG